MHPLKHLHGHHGDSTNGDAPRWRMNEPREWSVDAAGTLRMTTCQGTDLWQRTHYGFRNDNAHFLSVPLANDFVMTVGVRWTPSTQYDQAGIYVRASPSCWVKASCEFENAEEPAGLGCVVTNSGYSDWSTCPVSNETREMYYRLRRRGPNFIIHSSTDSQKWTQLRLFRLLESDVQPLDVGLYACSPNASSPGMEVEFFQWQIDEVTSHEKGWEPNYHD